MSNSDTAPTLRVHSEGALSSANTIDNLSIHVVNRLFSQNLNVCKFLPANESTINYSEISHQYINIVLEGLALLLLIKNPIKSYLETDKHDKAVSLQSKVNGR